MMFLSEPSPDSDLTWLAFRYVAGELTDDQAEAFERRLAEDQSAREALAEAVGLAAAVAALPPDTPGTFPIVRRRSVWPAIAATSAAAACLALVLGFSSKTPKHPDAVAVDRAGKIALTWSGLRQEFNREKDGSDELIASPVEMETAPVESDNIADLGPPAWLLEAAALGDRATGPREN